MLAATTVVSARVREVMILLIVSVFHIEQVGARSFVHEAIFDRVINAVRQIGYMYPPGNEAAPGNKVPNH